MGEPAAEFSEFSLSSEIGLSTRASGFTLIELLSVIIIIGILATSVVTSLNPSRTFQLQSARDQLILALATAQQRAMSRVNGVRVTTSGNQINILEDTDGDGDFSTSVSLNTGGVQYPVTLLANQALTGAILDYDRLGRTSATVLTVSQGSAVVSVNVTSSGFAY